MAESLTIRANSNHEYHVPATVAGRQVDLLLDTGFTNDECLMGVSLDEPSYRAVESRLCSFERVSVSAPGQPARIVDSGIGTVALPGLDDTDLETKILRAGENLLGVCYFHRLQQYNLTWDFSGRSMIIARKAS